VELGTANGIAKFVLDLLSNTNETVCGSPTSVGWGRHTIQTLRTWDSRIQVYTSTDRNLTQAFNELDTLKDKLGLPSAIIEKSAYIYRKAQENRLVLGRSISAVLVAAIYTACREMGIPRTLNDIATNRPGACCSSLQHYLQLMTK
jgi:transcription initiation factor TFIIB